MNRRIGLALNLVLAVAGLIGAGNALAEFEIAYDVEAKDANKKNIDSYFGRELRSLGDVQIMDNHDNADYYLNLKVWGGTEFEGKRGGYVAALTIIDIRSIHTTLNIVESLDPKWEKPRIDKSTFIGLYKGVGRYVGTFLYSYGPDQLRKMVRDIVTGFDSNELQEQRKIKRKIKSNSKN